MLLKMGIRIAIAKAIVKVKARTKARGALPLRRLVITRGGEIFPVLKRLTLSEVFRFIRKPRFSIRRDKKRSRKTLSG